MKTSRPKPASYGNIYNYASIDYEDADSDARWVEPGTPEYASIQATDLSAKDARRYAAWLLRYAEWQEAQPTPITKRKVRK